LLQQQQQVRLCELVEATVASPRAIGEIQILLSVNACQLTGETRASAQLSSGCSGQSKVMMITTQPAAIGLAGVGDWWVQGPRRTSQFYRSLLLSLQISDRLSVLAGVLRIDWVPYSLAGATIICLILRFWAVADNHSKSITAACEYVARVCLSLFLPVARQQRRRGLDEVVDAGRHAMAVPLGGK
jgi:hypothetical protein